MDEARIDELISRLLVVTTKAAKASAGRVYSDKLADAYPMGFKAAELDTIIEAAVAVLKTNPIRYYLDCIARAKYEEPLIREKRPELVDVWTRVVESLNSALLIGLHDPTFLQITLDNFALGMVQFWISDVAPSQANGNANSTTASPSNAGKSPSRNNSDHSSNEGSPLPNVNGTTLTGIGTSSWSWETRNAIVMEVWSSWLAGVTDDVLLPAGVSLINCLTFYLQQFMGKSLMNGLNVKILKAILNLLQSSKSLCTELTKQTTWMPEEKTGFALSNYCYLGVWVSSTLPAGHGVHEYFMKSENSSLFDAASDIPLSMTFVRDLSVNSVKILFDIFSALVRSSSATQLLVLDWVSALIPLNRSMTHGYMAPNGNSAFFLLTVVFVMLRFCEPFLDPLGGLAGKIDWSYLFVGARCDFSKINCLHASESEFEKLRQLVIPRFQEPIKSVFVTECFFITSELVHICIVPSHNMVMENMRAATAARSQSDERLRNAIMYARSIQCLLTERSFLNLWRSFVALQLGLIWKLLDGISKDIILPATQAQVSVSTSRTELSVGTSSVTTLAFSQLESSEIVPTPANMPALFLACMPDRFMEDPVEAQSHLGRLGGPPLAYNLTTLEVSSLTLALAARSSLIRNPHLRGSIVLALGIIGNDHGERLSLFDSHQIAREYLMPALLNLYIDVEFFEGSRAFYEKFMTRYRITSLLLRLGERPDYKQKAIDFTNDSDRFLKLVHMMLSDSAYLLDECMEKLEGVHQYEEDLKANRVAPEDAQRRASESSRATESVSSYLQLGRVSLAMMLFWTKERANSFLRPELIDRFASLLNMYAKQLPNIRLAIHKLSDSESIEIDPIVLLASIAELYSCFHKVNARKFVDAMIRDRRSFDMQLLMRQLNLLQENIRTVGPYIIEEFRTVVAWVGSIDAETNSKAMAVMSPDRRSNESSSMVIEAEDSAEEEVPDEFLDPITYTIMDEPVILRTSGVTVDKTTIERHMLGSNVDPFNRAPIKPEDISVNEALKAKIDAWKAK